MSRPDQCLFTNKQDIVFIHLAGCVPQFHQIEGIDKKGKEEMWRRDRLDPLTDAGSSRDASASRRANGSNTRQPRMRHKRAGAEQAHKSVEAEADNKPRRVAEGVG
jgi:hypothetical protein